MGPKALLVNVIGVLWGLSGLLMVTIGLVIGPSTLP